MTIIERLKMDYSSISKRLVEFITEHSDVEYVEGSEKVVEGGLKI